MQPYESASHGHQWAISKDPCDPSRAAGPAIALAATATGFKMPAVSQGLFSPVKLGGAPAALVGPPPKVRMAAPAAPMRPEEPYHVLDLEDGLQ